MAPTPTRATPARKRMRGHRCPGGHGDAGQRGLPQNLHRRRSGRLGGEGRSHSGVAQEKCAWRPGMHVGARPGAPATVADGPQARVGAAETEREAGCVMAFPEMSARQAHTILRGRGAGRGTWPWLYCGSDTLALFCRETEGSGEMSGEGQD